MGLPPVAFGVGESQPMLMLVASTSSTAGVWLLYVWLSAASRPGTLAASAESTGLLAERPRALTATT